jgi:hypothetical protein
MSRDAILEHAEKLVRETFGARGKEASETTVKEIAAKIARTVPVVRAPKRAA